MHALWTKFVWGCPGISFPLIGIILATSGLFWTGHKDAAFIISNLGTVLVFAGNLLYIVLVRSPSRWPRLHWTTRLHKVLTFQI